MGSVDWSAAGTIGALGFSIVIGGLTMAWRLGRLEQKVTDMKDDVHEIKGVVDDLRERR